MELWHILLLPLAGLIAGVMNAIAGGGSLIVYPSLLAIGIPPIAANATTTAVVLPGSISSAWAYRRHIAKLKLRYFLLLIPCLIGGAVGALLLTNTPSNLFELLVPWLILIASLLTVFQSRIHRWLDAKPVRRFEKRHMPAIFTLAALIAFAVSVYGGYFSAGIGIVVLALLGLTQLSDIHEMNGLKNLATISMHLASLGLFVAAGLIIWYALPLLFLGNAIGGYVAARYSEHLHEQQVRNGIAVIGLGLAIVLLARLNGILVA